MGENVNGEQKSDQCDRTEDQYVSSPDLLAKVSCRAFPQEIVSQDQERIVGYGLTKRELFAAMAMQGLRAGIDVYDPQEVAKMAVADADALLKELSQ